MGLWRNIVSASQSSSLPNGRRYEVVGTRPIRHDGVEKVTGQARYGADIRLPGMLYGTVWGDGCR
jgi:hypothetical protein